MNSKPYTISKFCGSIWSKAKINNGEMITLRHVNLFVFWEYINWTGYSNIKITERDGRTLHFPINFCLTACLCAVETFTKCSQFIEISNFTFHWNLEIAFIPVLNAFFIVVPKVKELIFLIKFIIECYCFDTFVTEYR